MYFEIIVVCLEGMTNVFHKKTPVLQLNIFINADFTPLDLP